MGHYDPLTKRILSLCKMASAEVGGFRVISVFYETQNAEITRKTPSSASAAGFQDRLGLLFLLQTI